HFGTVGLEVEQFPCAFKALDELPLSLADRLVALVFPVNGVVSLARSGLEDRREALALERRDLAALDAPRIVRLADGDARRDEVAGLIRERVALPDHGGPGGDERRRDPAFVDPVLVETEGRIRGVRPRKPVALERFLCPDRRPLLAPVDLLGAAAVVGEEEDQ